MSNSKSDAWYYSRGEEKIGPLTFNELKAMAVSGDLNPRLDLVWRQGMREWIMAGKTDNLFDRAEGATEKPRENLAPAANPLEIARGGSMATSMGSAADWPGSRRRSFLFVWIIFPIVWVLGLEFGKSHLQALIGPELMKIAEIWLPYLPLILGLFILIGRFRNLGMSPLWTLVSWVPLINLWLGHRCFSCPAGYAYHKKMDGVGIFLAIIYWLFVIVFILAGLSFLSTLGDSEIRGSFMDTLRKFADAIKNLVQSGAPKP